MAAHIRGTFAQCEITDVKMALCLRIQVFRLVAMRISVAYSHGFEERPFRFQSAHNYWRSLILDNENSTLVRNVRAQQT